MTFAIDASGLRKNFVVRRRTVTALMDVSLGISRGERIVITGPSGSGKSTLLGCIAGLVKPDFGFVRYNVPRRSVRLLFQHPTRALDPRFTAQQSVEEPLVLMGSAGTDAAFMIRRVGLGPEHAGRYPHELSGGERQRVALARALVGAPDVVLADEPVSALDPAARAEVLQLLLDLQHEIGFACVIVTHDRDIQRLATRHVVLKAGCVVSDGAQSV